MYIKNVQQLFFFVKLLPCWLCVDVKKFEMDSMCARKSVTKSLGQLKLNRNMVK